MWWIYYNAYQLSAIAIFSGEQPHYTIAYKPIFEFIVLGIIPGTSFELGFITTLSIILSVSIGALLYMKYTPRRFVLKHA